MFIYSRRKSSKPQKRPHYDDLYNNPDDVLARNMEQRFQWVTDPIFKINYKRELFPDWHVMCTELEAKIDFALILSVLNN